MMKNEVGFTMFEVVVSVAIATVIAMMALPVAHRALRTSFDEETRNEMSEIRRGILTYYGEVGAFPDALADLMDSSGPFVFGGMNPDGMTSELRDEWGTTYAWLPSEVDTRKILRSCGPNRVDDDGNGDDIELWVDLSDFLREETNRELEQIREAIVRYNWVNLPAKPLPADIDLMISILQAKDYLPEEGDFVRDAWGKLYVPGPFPVQAIYRGGEYDRATPELTDPDEELVTICHRPPGLPAAARTLAVAASTVQLHLSHGDSLGACCPVTLDFETEDDLVTALADGQDISTPPEFGGFVRISATGPNYGPAIFDSTVGGPNDPGRDDDLLVDRGNLLMVQEDSTQTESGIFDYPDDDAGGGTITFDFVTPVEPLSVVLVDVDPGAQDVIVTLVDGSGNTRVFTVPNGWTTDIAHGGPPGYDTLNLTTLDPQEGVSASATCTEAPSFNPSDVVRMDVTFQSSGALDDLVFCPSGR